MLTIQHVPGILCLVGYTWRPRDGHSLLGPGDIVLMNTLEARFEEYLIGLFLHTLTRIDTALRAEGVLP